MSPAQAPSTAPSPELLEQLCGLRPVTDVRALLRRALSCLAYKLDARVAWLGLFEDDGCTLERWSVGVGFDGPAPVSHSVMQTAVQTGEVQRIASVIGHPRFQHTRSGANYRITSVVCLDLGGRARAVLYVQDRTRGVFSPEDAETAARFARMLRGWVDDVAEAEAPEALRDILSAAPTPVEATPTDAVWLAPLAPDDLVSWSDAKDLFRKHYLTYALEAHGHNKTQAAKALGLARARMFSLVRELDIRPL